VTIFERIVMVRVWMTSRFDAPHRERGQTTAEYALVLLGAATVALLLVAWAVKTGKITVLFDAVLDKILQQV
jgi:hypothetical protein